MGWLLSQCYSHPENCRATVRVGNFQAGDSEQKPEMHKRSNSKQMKKLKGRSSRACLCLNSFFKGVWFQGYFLFIFMELLGKRFSWKYKLPSTRWHVGSIFLFKLRCKTNQTHIPRLRLEKTKKSKHEYGRYLEPLNILALANTLKISGYSEGMTGYIHLSHPSLFHSSLSSFLTFLRHF